MSEINQKKIDKNLSKKIARTIYLKINLIILLIYKNK